MSEIKKLEKVQEVSQKIGEFLDWLLHTKGIKFFQTFDKQPHGTSIDPVYAFLGCSPFNLNIQEILAEYFDIDLQKLEHEKQEMLEEFRNRYDKKRLEASEAKP